MKKLTVGILAHVDSGKTTLSEAMLYLSGEIRKAGRVDHRDAFLDTHEIERERGITIFSKQAVLHTGNTHITLLDTPGHIDFSAETERTLQVLDYAILVINGADGVQSHTETLWKMLGRYNIPAFIFVNKMDLSPDGHDALLSELKQRLDGGCVNFTDEYDDFSEDIAVSSEKLMEKFIENGEISDDDIAEAVYERKIFPCYFGAALKFSGVEEFLSGLDKYTKTIIYGGKFGARVFKISEDEQKNRLTYMKITGGSLKVKSLLSGKNGSEEWSEKINQLRIYSGAKFRSADEVGAGEICAAVGLTQTYSGEGLGFEADSGSMMTEAALNYRVDILDNTDIHTALVNLRKIETEDPQLHIIWNERLREIHIQLMGEIQLEVLKRIIADRFNMEVGFSQGSIAYKETIAAPVEGVGHYEPLRHYAEVHLVIEPTERGSGIHFAASCSEDVLDKNWQRLILTHLQEKTHIGVLTGSPVTDLKITLTAGRAHLKHTEGGDFRQATYRAVRQGLMCAESVLLEPWYDFRIEVPDSSIGRAMTDIQRMGGEFGLPESKDGISVLTGSVPVGKMLGYHSEVVEYTRGTGRLSCVLSGYRECPESDEIIKRTGYNPESDLENTPDSVFCSHGAGFEVKWDKVPEYMHLESTLKTEKKTENIVPETRVREYIDGIAADKELMRIFERTYGPLKRDSYSAMKSVRKKNSVSGVKVKGQKIPDGPEYLLVDGYNIIFAWDELRKTAEQNLEEAREQLISVLSNYQGVKQCELILVFDAYKVKNNPGELEKRGNITVVYTKEAETADMYIEKVTHQIGRKHRVRVATSDGLEQLIILGGGAFRMSAAMLKEEVESVEKAIREFIKKH